MYDIRNLDYSVDFQYPICTQEEDSLTADVRDIYIDQLLWI